MTRIVFQEIAVRGVKKFKDPGTGKQRQVTRKFCQTVNPFNKNADGTVKTPEQIRAEIIAQRDAWLKEPANG